MGTRTPQVTAVLPAMVALTLAQTQLGGGARLKPHCCCFLTEFFFSGILRDLDVVMLFLGQLLESDPWARAHYALWKPTWRVLSSSGVTSEPEMPLRGG